VIFYKNSKIKKQKFDGKKGHQQEIQHFINICLGKEKPQLSLDEIIAVTKATFRAIQSLEKKQLVEV
jgi:hypothetical protein